MNFYDSSPWRQKKFSQIFFVSFLVFPLCTVLSINHFTQIPTDFLPTVSAQSSGTSTSSPTLSEEILKAIAHVRGKHASNLANVVYKKYIPLMFRDFFNKTFSDISNGIARNTQKL